MYDGGNIITEHNEGNSIIMDKKTGAKLTINIDGSWTFVAPHLPELPDDYKGNSILSFFSCVLLNQRNS